MSDKGRLKDFDGQEIGSATYCPNCGSDNIKGGYVKTSGVWTCMATVHGKLGYWIVTVCLDCKGTFLVGSTFPLKIEG